VGDPLDEPAPGAVHEGPPADPGGGGLRGAEVAVLGGGKVQEITLCHHRMLRIT
jgi:hypothetical protein